MRNDRITTLQNNIIRYLKSYIGNLDKWRQKNLIYFFLGIILSGTLVLSEMARKLADALGVKVKTWVNRFSYNLNSKLFKGEQLFESIIREKLSSLSSRAYIIVDIGDINKEYAKKMQYIDYVRDGSQEKLAKGYWTVDITLLQNNQITYLFSIPFSIENFNTPSFNGYLENIFLLIHEISKGMITFIIDRGFGWLRWVSFFSANKMNFLVRMQLHNQVYINGKFILIEDLPQEYGYSYWFVHQRFKGARLTSLKYQVLNNVQIRDPDTKEILPQKFTLIYYTYRHREGAPIFILTPLNIKDNHPEYIIDTYIQRWTIDEIIRFAKQKIGFENFQVENFHAIVNLLLIAGLVVGFIISLENLSKLMQSFIVNAAQVIPRKVIKHLWYRLAMGLPKILTSFSIAKDIVSEWLAIVAKIKKKTEKNAYIDIKIKIALGGQI